MTEEKREAGEIGVSSGTTGDNNIATLTITLCGEKGKTIATIHHNKRETKIIPSDGYLCQPDGRGGVITKKE